jgi:hypothetical protein
MYSTLRASAARLAAKEVLAKPGAFSIGKQLRSSSIAVGFEKSRENAGKVSITETKQKYIEQPLGGNQDPAENLKRARALMDSRIDLAAGGDKSCREWQSDLTDSFAANADAKFAAKPRPPIDGSYLRKSEVTLGAHPTGPVDYETETKTQFAAPFEPERAVNYGSTLGKELRAHSWDHNEEMVKTTTKWRARQSEEMAKKADEKFNCVKPTAFDQLAKQLRKSNLYLGKDEVDFTVGGRRPPGPARTRNVPGLIGHARY